MIEATHDGARGESRPPVDPYGAMLPRGIGALGGARVVPISLVRQIAPMVPDLPDHPADRLVQQLRGAGDRQEARLPLTVVQSQDSVTLLTVDFGRIVAGHVELEVDAPRAGARLRRGRRAGHRPWSARRRRDLNPRWALRPKPA